VAHAFEDEEVPRNGLADDDLFASVEIEIGDYGITQIKEVRPNYVIENQIHLIIRRGFENFQRRRKAAEVVVARHELENSVAVDVGDRRVKVDDVALLRSRPNRVIREARGPGPFIPHDFVIADT